MKILLLITCIIINLIILGILLLTKPRRENYYYNWLSDVAGGVVGVIKPLADAGKKGLNAIEKLQKGDLDGINDILNATGDIKESANILGDIIVNRRLPNKPNEVLSEEMIEKMKIVKAELEKKLKIVEDNINIIKSKEYEIIDLVKELRDNELNKFGKINIKERIKLKDKILMNLAISIYFATSATLVESAFTDIYDNFLRIHDDLKNMLTSDEISNLTINEPNIGPKISFLKALTEPRSLNRIKNELSQRMELLQSPVTFAEWDNWYMGNKNNELGIYDYKLVTPDPNKPNPVIATFNLIFEDAISQIGIDKGSGIKEGEGRVKQDGTVEVETQNNKYWNSPGIDEYNIYTFLNPQSRIRFSVIPKLSI